MRLALAAAVMLLWVVPAAAASRNPAACMRIAHQLVHYDTMKQRAAALGNEMWMNRFKAHIADLEDQQAEICPDQAAANRTAQQLADLLKLAAQGALSFFTLGAY